MNIPKHCDPHVARTITWDDGVNEKWKSLAALSVLGPRQCGQNALVAVLVKAHCYKEDRPDTWTLMSGTLKHLFEERSDSFRDEDLVDFLLAVSQTSCTVMLSLIKALGGFFDIPDHGDFISRSTLLTPILFQNLLQLPQDVSNEYYETVVLGLRPLILSSATNWPSADVENFSAFLTKRLAALCELSPFRFRIMAPLLLDLFHQNWVVLEFMLRLDRRSLLVVLLKASMEHIPRGRELSIQAAQFSKGEWVELTLSFLSSAISEKARVLSPDIRLL